MPGGGMKAFPPLNLDQEHQERQKKLIQRGKSVDQKDSPDKERIDKNRPQPCSSKSEQLKTPTKEQKDHIKQEQLRMKSEHKALQKIEKEQHKQEKEKEKEQQKLEKEAHKAELKQQKEAHKLEKEQLKLEKDQPSTSKNCFKAGLSAEKPLKDSPSLKTQKSLDISCLKNTQNVESPHRPPARNSVDLQYTRDLLEATEITQTSPFSSTSSLAKIKK